VVERVVFKVQTCRTSLATRLLGREPLNVLFVGMSLNFRLFVVGLIGSVSLALVDIQPTIGPFEEINAEQIQMQNGGSE
jgi:hypothetical protein